MPHDCNAWCGDNKHADVFYSSLNLQEVGEARLNRPLSCDLPGGWQTGMIDHIELVPDAPPPSTRPNIHDVESGIPLPGDTLDTALHAYRVWVWFPPKPPRPIFGITSPPGEQQGCMNGGGRTLRG